MEMMRDSRGFPGEDGAASRTPHSKAQLKMTSDRSRGGLRLLYRQQEGYLSGSSTPCYCIEHPADGYDYTVITPTLSKRGSQDWFRSDIHPRSQRIDPPEEWATALWNGWIEEGDRGVQRALQNFLPQAAAEVV